MGGNQSIHNISDSVINSLTDVQQNSIQTSSSSCTNENIIRFTDGCKAKNITIDQSGNCFASTEAMQDSMQKSIDLEKVKQEAQQKATAVTQNLSFSLTNQELTNIVNNVQNIVTDVGQTVFQGCDIKQSGVNEFICSGADIDGVVINQSNLMKGLSKCAQTAVNDSSVTKDLSSYTKQVADAKVENAMASCAMIIIAIVIVIGMVFVMPEIAGAKMVGGVEQQMARSPLLIFGCVGYYWMSCIATWSASKTETWGWKIYKGFRFPPKWILPTSKLFYNMVFGTLIIATLLATAYVLNPNTTAIGSGSTLFPTSIGRYRSQRRVKPPTLSQQSIKTPTLPEHKLPTMLGTSELPKSSSSHFENIPPSRIAPPKVIKTPTPITNNPPVPVPVNNTVSNSNNAMANFNGYKFDMSKPTAIDTTKVQGVVNGQVFDVIQT